MNNRMHPSVITLSAAPEHLIQCMVLNEEPIVTYDTLMADGVVYPSRGRHIIDTIRIRIPWDDIDAHAILHHRLYNQQRTSMCDYSIGTPEYKFDINFSTLCGIPDVDAIGCFIASVDYNVCAEVPSIVYGISTDYIPKLMGVK